MGQAGDGREADNEGAAFVVDRARQRGQLTRYGQAHAGQRPEATAGILDPGSPNEDLVDRADIAIGKGRLQSVSGRDDAANSLVLVPGKSTG